VKLTYIASSLSYLIGWQEGRPLLFLVANKRHVLVSDVPLKNKFARWLRRED
jgi:hypothetical protein